ncbi:glycosyltransferase [Methylobacterium sp. J-090]|uniref:glycosyltransferase n=1 Tax=Methylobacterium sp. J-090 TaxID=2836666 RepID=UPI001FB9EC78|nr:glycosyltransferase [Methylobacterium sp. J-090]MCJ2081507.1 glycosyltransferase [Methylobacterium sp. J-090]
MNRRPIGYYVHHQGAGHAARARLIAQALNRPCTLLGTFHGADPGITSCLDLPDDRIAEGFDGRDQAASRPLAFHYAPLGIDGLRARMARIAAWVAAADPVLIIIDVSVEVALFARLLSVPTLVVRLPGDRTDPPHLEAFRGAERLLAFFPETLDSGTNPDWVRAKTAYLGFLAAEPRVDRPPEDGSLVVVYGRGGAGGDGADLAAAARAVPERQWHVLGPVADVPDETPENLHLHGWVSEIAPYLDRAALVIGAGGDGLVSDVVARAKRFVCIPEPRAFDEQAATARALAAQGAAIHRPAWGPSEAWPDLIRAGVALDPARIASLGRRDAVGRAARLIGDIADGLDPENRAPQSVG